MDRAATADRLIAPLRPLARSLTARRPTVLAYHDVGDADRFAAQLDHVARRFEPISLGTLLDGLDGGGVPRDAVLVTFDDGDRSMVEQALPLLQERGIPAVSFVVSGLVDTDTAPWWVEVETLATQLGEDGHDRVRELKLVPDRVRRQAVEDLRARAGDRVRVENLTTDDLRTLQAGGVDVGNHSWSHPLLDQCDAETVRHELSRAHEHLRGALGHAPRAVAYPNGNVDARAVGVAAELGYGAGFLFDHQVAAWPPADPLQISRVRADAAADLPRFKAIVSGAHPLVHHALRRP